MTFDPCEWLEHRGMKVNSSKFVPEDAGELEPNALQHVFDTAGVYGWHFKEEIIAAIALYVEKSALGTLLQDFTRLNEHCARLEEERNHLRLQVANLAQSAADAMAQLYLDPPPNG